MQLLVMQLELINFYLNDCLSDCGHSSLKSTILRNLNTNYMKNYPTTQTNIRTPKLLIERIKAKNENYNGFAQEALSQFVRDMQLERANYAWIGYATYHGARPSFLKPYYDGGTVLKTYRLKQLDVDWLKLNQYSLSRCLMLALVYKLTMN